MTHKLVIAGATGLVGRHALVVALHDQRIEKIIAPTRRPLSDLTFFETDAGLLEENLLTGRLVNPTIDFTRPPPSLFNGVTAVACAIGTTRRKAGSKEAFYAVDHGLVLTLATAAHTAGVPTFTYVSSVGAKTHALSFYLQVKGQIEADLAQLGFNALTIVRPSLLGGERDDSRTLERAGLLAMGALSWLTPKRYRVITAAQVADRLIHAALEPGVGLQIIESESI